MSKDIFPVKEGASWKGFRKGIVHISIKKGERKVVPSDTLIHVPDSRSIGEEGKRSCYC